MEKVHKSKMAELKPPQMLNYLLDNIKDLFDYHTGNDKETISKRYLQRNDYENHDGYYFTKSVCERCNGEVVMCDGVNLCKSCFNTTPYFLSEIDGTYLETPVELTTHGYKRLTHFKEMLQRFQGKEITNIPDEVIEKIKAKIKMERITNLTHDTVKYVLRKLKYSKYYDHIYYILDSLGEKVPFFSIDVENKLTAMFICLQPPYSIICPKDRVNFLNYHFVLLKLCELIRETTYIKDIPQMKNDCMKEQLILWTQLCKHLNWTVL